MQFSASKIETKTGKATSNDEEIALQTMKARSERKNQDGFRRRKRTPDGNAGFKP
jgi:hypothetical protein